MFELLSGTHYVIFLKEDFFRPYFAWLLNSYVCAFTRMVEAQLTLTRNL